MGFIIALLSGALTSIQGILSTEVTKQTSVWVAAGWVQPTAFTTCVVIWMFIGRRPMAGIMQAMPKYVSVGGIIGAFTIHTVVRSIGGPGPARTTLLTMVPQIIITYAIELLRLLGVEKAPLAWNKIVGAVTVIGGIIIFER